RIHCAERASVAPVASHSIGAERDVHQMRQPLVERKAKCETGKANETADPEADPEADLTADLTADRGTDQTADLMTVGESDAAAAVRTTATSAVRMAVRFVFRSAFRSVVRFAFKSGFRFVVKSAVWSAVWFAVRCPTESLLRAETWFVFLYLRNVRREKAPIRAVVALALAAVGAVAPRDQP